MKKYFCTPVLVALLTAFTTVRAQDSQEYLGLPGDNLNLFAVMKLFQESETIEKFERDLNAEDSRINNLDLNADRYVDYIRVLDNVDGNVHYIILQVAVSPKESQDVAVFTVIRESNGHVFIQLIGDEALYGKNYIVEPIIDETPNPGYMGNARGTNQNVTVVRTTTYEIAAWPIVRFIYMPNYVVWHSPWYYNYYPSYWRPWNQHYWHYYYGYHYNYYNHYYGHYRYWNQPRYHNWHDTYYSHRRSYSPNVASRIREGEYKRTYTRPETRSAGAELYNRTRQAQGSGTNVKSSGGRRDAGTVQQSTSRSRPSSTTTTRESTSGTRSSGTRQSTSGGTRQSGTGVSPDAGRTRSTSTTGTSRQSTGRSTETRSGGSTVTRQSGSTGQAPASTERRSTVNTNRTEKSTPATKSTTVKRSGERSGSSGSTQVSNTGRRSSGSSSKSSSQESKETKSARSGGRR